MIRRVVKFGVEVLTPNVREALRDWTLKRSLRQQRIEELGQLWDEGLASGPGKLGEMGSIKAEARRRHQAALDETK